MSIADLTTEELAMFQMIEAGFVGVEHHITLLRAKDAKTGEPCAVLTLYKHSILEEEFAVQPVARLLTDPSEVCEPVMEFTEIQERDRQRANGSIDDKTPVAEGDK